MFIRRTDAEAAVPILWPPDSKSWLTGMVGWHHWLNGHEFEQSPRDSEGQGSLECCMWGHMWPMGSQRVEHDEQLKNSNRRRFHMQRISPRPPSREWPGDRGERRRLISCPVCPLRSGCPASFFLSCRCSHFVSLVWSLQFWPSFRSKTSEKSVHIRKNRNPYRRKESQNHCLLEPDTEEPCSKCWKDGESRTTFCLNYRSKSLNRESDLIHSFLILKNQIKN